MSDTSGKTPEEKLLLLIRVITDVHHTLAVPFDGHTLALLRSTGSLLRKLKEENWIPGLSWNIQIYNDDGSCECSHCKGTGIQESKIAKTDPKVLGDGDASSPLEMSPSEEKNIRALYRLDKRVLGQWIQVYEKAGMCNLCGNSGIVTVKRDPIEYGNCPICRRGEDHEDDSGGK